MEDYNNDTEPIKVVIEDFTDDNDVTTYGIYDESGQYVLNLTLRILTKPVFGRKIMDMK